MERKVYKPRYGEAASYDPQPLFLDFHRFRDEERRYALVEAELVRMAREGTLYLTDCLSQPGDDDRAIQNAVAGVILGRVTVDRKQRMREVHQDLRDYRVRVRSLNGESIKWCRDMVRGAPINKGKARAAERKQYYRVEEEWVDTGENDTLLSLQEAVLCLKQSGKHVRRAKRQGLQAKLWKCEEVKPELKVVPDPEPTPEREVKRGRQTFAAASQ